MLTSYACFTSSEFNKYVCFSKTKQSEEKEYVYEAV